MQLVLKMAAFTIAVLLLGLPAASQIRENPHGRFRPEDWYRAEYIYRVNTLRQNPSLVQPLPNLPRDARIRGVGTTLEVRSDQGPVSAAVSPAGQFVYCLRGSNVLRQPKIWNRIALQASANAQRALSEIVKVATTNGTEVLRQAGRGLVNPQRMAVDYAENIWVTDRDAYQVAKLRAGDYSKVLAIGTRAVPAGPWIFFCLPSDVAASSDGTIFVTDSTSIIRQDSASSCMKNGGPVPQPSRVVRFRSNGAYVDHFDLFSSFFARISLDERQNRIFVSEGSAGRVYVYSAGLRGAGGLPFGTFLGQLSIGNSFVDLEAHPKEDLLYVGTGAQPLGAWNFGLTVNVSRVDNMRVQAIWSPPQQPYGFYSFGSLTIDRDATHLYATDDNGNSTNLWKFALEPF